jgi:thiol-disulfide isomerase/thioredoxin
MKKFVILGAAALFTIVSCKKDDKDNSGGNSGSASNPVAGLVVKNEKKVLVVENTGAWCQYCPNGAEIMYALQEAYDYVIPVAVHNNDGLANSIAQAWEAAFPAGGYPTIHVNEEALENYSQAEGAVTAAYQNSAEIGLAHKVTDVDTGWTVDVKVEVFEDMSGRNFFIQSFLTLEDVLSKDYSGGPDLRQVSSVPIVDKGPTGGNSTWAQDAAFVDTIPSARAGDVFYHKDNVWAVAAGDSNMTSWGMPLALINPFGMDYVSGDVIGSQFTPIQFTIAPPTGVGNLQFKNYGVMTIIWEMVVDGGEVVYRFTNAYKSEVDK